MNAPFLSWRRAFLQHNWLVRRIARGAGREAIDRYARGILLDIGCGEKPHGTAAASRVDLHIGLDTEVSGQEPKTVDLIATAYETGVRSGAVDTVLGTAVLEHLERPLEALCEAFRVLKPGGHVILTAPLFWHLHEEPRDFFRYTKHGLDYLLREAGFDVLFIRPLSGFLVTFSQEWVYLLLRVRRGLLKYPVMAIQSGIQLLAYALNRWDRSYRFTWAYLAVAKKADSK